MTWMPSIKPFKGIIYNLKKTKSLSSVIAPPYDVISEEMQDDLYRHNPYNIVRLTLGEIRSTDDVKDNRYTRAKTFFESWLKGHVMIQDRKEAIYIYSQTYRQNAKYVERIGFIALMKLSMGKKKNILPHENTLLAPKLDRLNLIRSVKANLEPIFVLYEDRSHRILDALKRFCRENRPFIDIEFDKVVHKVWRLADPDIIRRIQKFMQAKDVFIADGHHRYEAAFTYALETKAAYLMSYFVELNEKMLTVLPTHRLIKDIGILKKEDIKSRLSKFFDMEKISNLDSLVSKLNAMRELSVFGAYLGEGIFHILKLKDARISDRLIKNHSKDWKRLDVTILHLFILEYILGISDDEDNVEFVKDPKEAARLVDKGKYKIAFFLNPTKVREVEHIAKLGERMPRKATYFYPKPLSGLVINRL
ncbi:MAG: DUF1015 domain-containing protein [Candidatus Omnitrophica bacterium]|nr:DUF1015 domain-containing protein [Candidatus Omnitrophota bacterium]